MDEPGSLQDTISGFFGRNERLRIRYKHGIKGMQSQAAIRMVHSMLDQMRQHAHILSTIHGSDFQDQDGTPPAEPELDDREFLLSIRDAETEFGEEIRKAAAMEGISPEMRQTLTGLADGRLKFAAWASDHIDLLALFGA